MKYYSEAVSAVLGRVNSDKNGLSSAESARRLAQNGKNKLVEPKRDSLVKRFFLQMVNPMILILIAAAVLSGITAAYSGEGFADVIIILTVVIANAILGVYQENKAEKAIEALQKMTAATSRVLRDGRIAIVQSEELVVGDVVLLEAGDAIPADGRIIESSSLKIEEAALTGESVPVSKFIDILNLAGSADVPLGDRKNMCYMGSTVVYGRGAAVVTAVGMDTEMGKIADVLSKAEDKATPLQMRLDQLSRILTVIILGVCAVIFAIGMIRAGEFTAEVMLDTFMAAVALAVAAIPEGLAAVVTIVLAIGVTNMSRRNAVIRRLTAVETLGCAQIICSDKTGTLTQNKMTVVEYYSQDQTLLATAMALCSDAQLQTDNAIGEPTECALVNYAFSLGLNKNTLKDSCPRIGEAPFDSARKMMSTVHHAEGRVIQYTKGAPDEVLKLCTHYLGASGVLPMTPQIAGEIMAANHAMAQKALRVLAAARRLHDSEPTDYSSAALEQGLCFIGLTGMIDPVRPEVKASIVECREAGIRPIMITGDHIDTACAIARELGILEGDAQAVSGTQLNAMDDAEFAARFKDFSVYARVQPEHKVRIVNAWRQAGFITAMTGDGVNDAPSIKSADIGVGMGISGTDVTKNVADMVLADDNFATIVGAVGEGRRIYDNIRKTIQYLISTNMGEVIAVFVATLMGFTLLKAVHLLWLNLITDCFPALALGMERAETGVMKRKPRNPNDSIFAGGMGFDTAYQGIVIAIITFVSYFIGHYVESGLWEVAQSDDGITMAFLTMSMAEIFHSFNMRSQRGSLFSVKTSNTILIWGGALSLLSTLLVIYVPFLAAAFDFTPISLFEYFIGTFLAFLTIPIVEVVKVFQRRLAAAR